MGKLIKLILVTIAALAMLGIAAVVLVPRMIDVQRYKPVILEKVATITGRQVALDGKLKLSVFPWVGVSFSNLRIGNPQGFANTDFIVVKSFEAHMKLMSLLKREVQVESFILDGLKLYLEKRKDGKANWQGLGGEMAQQSADRQKGVGGSESAGLGLKSLNIGSFAIRDALIEYADQQQGITRQVSQLTLELKDVGLVRPIGLQFKAVIDGKPLAISGMLGPLGPLPGQGTVPIDLTFSGLDQLNGAIKGQVDRPADRPAYALSLDLKEFSPRKLLASLSLPMPVTTSDPAALDKMAVTMHLTGTPTSVAMADGKLTVDGSKLQFTADAKSFSPLNLSFGGKLDTIDLDRYLPPPPKADPGGAAAANPGQQAAKTDYAPLRKLSLDMQLNVAELKVKGGRMQNVQMKLVADKGVFQLNPFAMELYGGNVASTATVNVQGKSPATSFEARTTNVKVGPLLKDFANKDVLEGNLVSNMVLTLVGDTPEAIKKSLNGKGELLFTDGAIVGIDLAGMVRNVQASFGLAEKPAERPRTDFAELRAPFTIKNGMVNTPGTTMQSPLLRISAAGDANLVNEALDMRVEPKFVATLKGQGDTNDRAGLMVPVLVRGTFSSPQFSPDLTALLQGQLPDAGAVKKALEETITPDKVLPKEPGSPLEKGLKGLIPALPLK